MRIPRRSGGTLHAIERLTDRSRSAFRRYNPGSVLPRRIVPHVLGMAALELRYPVALRILVETDDALSYRIHATCTLAERALGPEELLPIAAFP